MIHPSSSRSGSGRRSRDLRPSVSLCLSLLLVFGCGVRVGNPADPDDHEPSEQTRPDGDPNDPAPASVTFALTDAPVDHVKSLFITVAGLEISKASPDGDVRGSKPEWRSVPLDEAIEVDLLRLQGGVKKTLGSLESVEAGRYRQLRLKLDADSTPRVVLGGGVEKPVKVPSGSQSGLKLATPFEIEPGEKSRLTIDFDVRKSLHATGHGLYILRPSLRLVDEAEAGHIAKESTGKDEGSVVCAYRAGAPKDETDACERAVTSTIVRNGRYKLGFLPAGEYDLRIFHPDGSYEDVKGEVVKAPEKPERGKRGKNDDDRDDGDHGDDEGRSGYPKRGEDDKEGKPASGQGRNDEEGGDDGRDEADRGGPPGFAGG